MRKRRLYKYRTSSINRISITYNGENFTFNLWDEVAISEAKLEQELRKQPSYYGFLLLLQKKLRTRFEELKLRRKKVYGALLIKAKNKQVGSRYMNDDTAKAWVEAHERYQRITRLCIKAKDDEDVIWAAVSAFNQRKDLLQTISSNIRKQV